VRGLDRAGEGVDIRRENFNEKAVFAWSRPTLGDMPLWSIRRKEDSLHGIAFCISCWNPLPPYMGAPFTEGAAESGEWAARHST
jgi:hypothetical protein